MNNTLETQSWRRSSYSNGQSACVEVADNLAETVPVRDSKAPDGPALTIPNDAWSTFVASLKDAG
ncbi:DUF397 domain-containing protein [Streptomyces sp. DSM 44917]|uniref:DUF397 domain-containing protein n=1 Tax=Streptomyces boetiae TaxID=3075541 RepID=A0ABU2L9J4_9ACTN|nr:DUF397 domain-containing protein [Streptomyces sp. DSM 44917]MDT0308002.1 DUF397 domain-containing protein [Streptomyces sp. DSM 44917]